MIIMKKQVSTPNAPAAIGPYSQAIKQSLENIKAILESEGYTMADIVKTTCLLDNIADFGAMNEVYATFFTDAAPARAAFEVGKLPKDALVEIEAVAYKA